MKIIHSTISLSKKYAKGLCIKHLYVILFFIASTIGMNAIAANSNSNSFYKPKDLKHKVNHFLYNYTKSIHKGEFRVQVGVIDQRLKLRLCSEELVFFVRQQQRQSRAITVGIRCEGITPWLVYVPSQIYLYKNVLSAKQLIRRGTIINADDLILVKREISNLFYAYYEKNTQIVNKVASRTIVAGTLLRPNLLKEPILVKRGQLVVLVAELHGIKVKMSGRALTSGSQGRHIRVRNLSSKRIIEGIIVGKGMVKIIL